MASEQVEDIRDYIKLIQTSLTNVVDKYNKKNECDELIRQLKNSIFPRLNETLGYVNELLVVIEEGGQVNVECADSYVPCPPKCVSEKLRKKKRNELCGDSGLGLEIERTFLKNKNQPTTIIGFDDYVVAHKPGVNIPERIKRINREYTNPSI